MELELELLRVRVSVSYEPGGLTECLWTGIVAQKSHKLLLSWGARVHNAVAQHRSQEQCSPSCSCSRSLQMLLEAAYSQLKFISGLHVCLLNSCQPTDSQEQPSPDCNLQSPVSVASLMALIRVSHALKSR